MGTNEPVAVDTSLAARTGVGDVLRAAYLAIIIASGGVVLAYGAAALLAAPPPRLWFVLASLTLISGLATTRMPGFPISVSLSDTFTMAAALLFGPLAGALLAGADALVMSMSLARESRTPARVLFNTAAAALAMWTAASLFFWLVPSPATATRLVFPLALFGAAYFLLNTGLVAVAVAIGRRLSVHQVWRDHFLPFLLTYCVGVSFAGLLLVLSAAGLATLHTLVIALPVVIIAAVGLQHGVDHLRERSAQHALLQSYGFALRSTGAAVLLSNEDGRVTFMNAMAEQLTGWTENAARGRPVEEVFNPQPCADGSAQGPREGILEEYLLECKDGTTLPLEVTHAFIRDEDEQIGGVIRIFHDISERRAADEERRTLLRREQAAREAADRANQSKDDFLATLSHELRTPAAAMIGWADLLRGGRLDSEHTRKAIAALERSARTQAAVLNDLLDMSRVVRGDMRLDVRRTNLADVIGQAIDTIEPAVIAKRLMLRVAVAPDVSIIDADSDRLRQILWNLLSNAVKFTPDEGWVEIDARRERDLVTIRVSDSGCGVAADFLPFVFERFRQADTSASRTHRGLGLGLAIVQHLVQLHGWTIEVASEGVGRGAQFKITLPAALRPPQGEDDAAGVARGQSSPPDHQAVSFPR
jgi:PAS domain S-box-containing protein